MQDHPVDDDEMEPPPSAQRRIQTRRYRWCGRVKKHQVLLGLVCAIYIVGVLYTHHQAVLVSLPSTVTTTTTAKRTMPKKNEKDRNRIVTSAVRRKRRIEKEKEQEAMDRERHNYLAALLSDFKNKPSIVVGSRQYREAAGEDFESSSCRTNKRLLLDQRDFTRIPGYIRGCYATAFYGYVFRDITQRFLILTTPPPTTTTTTSSSSSRNSSSRIVIVSSTINEKFLQQLHQKLVVSGPQQQQQDPNDHNQDAVDDQYHKRQLIKEYGYGISASFLMEGLFHGHTVLVKKVGADDPNTTTTTTDHDHKHVFDAVVRNPDADRDSTSRRSRLTITRQKMVVVPTQHPDTYDNYDYVKDNDDTSILLGIIDPERGQEETALATIYEYIQTGSIRYMILRIAAVARSTSTSEDPSHQLFGLDACQQLWNEGYKIQILSSSHVPTNQLNPYGPNTILQNRQEVTQFLHQGLQLATKSAATTTTPTPKKANTPMEEEAEQREEEVAFLSYVFVTRRHRLAMAIPSRKEYLNVTKFGGDFVLNIPKDGIPYQHCHSKHRPNTATATVKFSTKDTNVLNASCFGSTIHTISDNTNKKKKSNRNSHTKFNEIIRPLSSISGNKFYQNKSRNNRRYFEMKKISKNDDAKDDYDDDETSTSTDTTTTTTVIGMEVWYSHVNVSMSEAACVKCSMSSTTTPSSKSRNNNDSDNDDGDNYDNYYYQYQQQNKNKTSISTTTNPLQTITACTSRIILDQRKPVTNSSNSSNNRSNSYMEEEHRMVTTTMEEQQQKQRRRSIPNFLTIELKGVSRKDFDDEYKIIDKFRDRRTIKQLSDFAELKPRSGSTLADKLRLKTLLNNTSINIKHDYELYQASNQCNQFVHHNHHHLRHGSQIGSMFCFEYDHPNYCFNGRHTAQHVFNHLLGFIALFQQQHRKGRSSQIFGKNNINSTTMKNAWAAHVTIIDAGDDETQTLIGTLYQPLWSLLNRLHKSLPRNNDDSLWSNTVITIYSDDEKEPILYIKGRGVVSRNNRTQTRNNIANQYQGGLLSLQRIMNITNIGEDEVERRNADYYYKSTTHTTTMIQEEENSNSLQMLSSKVDPKNDVVGSYYYNDDDDHDRIAPPSVLSFYADIPKKHKLRLSKRVIENTLVDARSSNSTNTATTEKKNRRAAVQKGCVCATNIRDWFECDTHPWGNAIVDAEDTSKKMETSKKTNIHSSSSSSAAGSEWPIMNADADAENVDIDYRETFILIECSDRPIHLEIRIVRNPQLVQRSETNQIESGTTPATSRSSTSSGGTSSNSVNIIFLELDSISSHYADRHLPKTRELLKNYRITKKKKKKEGRNSDQGEYEYDYVCPNKGICSAEFPFTSLVGANTIPNQVAALSGCISSTMHELCGFDTNITTIMLEDLIGRTCNDPTVLHYGMSLQKIQKFSNAAYWCPKRDVAKFRTPWIFSITNSNGYINYFGEEFCYDYSPYVTQENVFPASYFDIQPHQVYCKLVGLKILKQNITVHKKHMWGEDISDPCIDGRTCTKSEEKSAISLAFINQMWDVYSREPKFAFLNVMAGHDYSSNWEVTIPLAEAYDDHLSEFLKTILSRNDANKTVIIIRSDHGLQKGPQAMDHSIQVEHRHPLTEILVPEALINDKTALFYNQNRMLTGYDLYRTMRSLVTPNINYNKNDIISAGIPDWSFDVLSMGISKNRTCEEAKVDIDLCRRVKVSREYGVCNSLDNNQIRFCPLKRKDPRMNATTWDANLKRMQKLIKKNEHLFS